jgi:hypothetical protein
MLLDTDGDGFSDADVLFAGTDPRDAASAARIGGFRVSGCDLAFEFPTVLGRSYCVETCTDLAKADWQIISDNLPGTGQPITIRDPDAATTNEPARFYRIRIKQP